MCPGVTALFCRSRRREKSLPGLPTGSETVLPKAGFMAAVSPQAGRSSSPCEASSISSTARFCRRHRCACRGSIWRSTIHKLKAGRSWQSAPA